MRRALLLVGSLTLLFAAPAAAQDKSVTSFGLYGKDSGAVASVSGPTVTFSFGGRSSHVIEAFRGHRARVACEQTPSTNLLDLPPSASLIKRVKVGRHVTKLKARIVNAPLYDFCIAYAIVRRRLYLVVASTTPKGAVALAEAEIAVNIAGAFQIIYAFSDNGKAPTTESAIARLGKLLVALPNASATPAPGQIGYWSDGDQHLVLAAMSPFGRRLFLEIEPNGVARENISALLPYSLFSL
jgi:hypothetical protein